MLFEPLLIVLFLKTIKCSLVIDAHTQKSIQIQDYCPKMKHCLEGAHVLCMYYDKEHVMGPKCRNPSNVTITPNLANLLLDIVNGLRSKISRGVEKGKNNAALPRGYGVFRLRWDSELATFAQTLANQCTLRHDFCRASKKFPDPGQAVSIVRFYGSKWLPAVQSENFTTDGPTEEKMEYAITQSLKTWYTQKNFVDIHMVTNAPNWNKSPGSQVGRLYLLMAYGAATHMGCGISAYNDMTYYDSRVIKVYNTMLLVCNFSAQPRLNAAIYNTVPPTDRETSFNPCGCPAGSLEDDDCLCLEVQRTSDPLPAVKKVKCPPGTSCNPTVVLLPIITMEDAPPEKLVTMEGFANDSLRQPQPENPETAVDSFEELIDNNFLGNKEVLRKSRKTLDLHVNINGKKQRSRDQDRPLLHSNGITTRNNDHKDSSHHDNKKKPLQGHSQKSSVFTNSPIFELPGSHYFLSSKKRDVVPRKDFSKGKQLVTKYLYSKNSMILPKTGHKLEHNIEKTVNNLNDAKSDKGLTYNLHTSTQPKEHKEHPEEVHFHDILTTETLLNTAEEKIIDRKVSNELNLSQDADKLEGNIAADENDKKFMALLDTLEQEVKHIELRDKEREIFDAKIKKIYGKIVGNPSTVLIAPEKNPLAHSIKSKGREEGVQKDEDDETVIHKLPPSYDTKLEDSNTIDELNYQSKHNTDTEIDEKYLKTDTTDVELDEIGIPLVKKQKSSRNNDDRDTYNRRTRNFRQKNRNHLNSLEFMRNRYDNRFKGRKPYKKSYRNDYEKLRHRSNTLDFKRNKNYYGTDAYEDILSSERRKYYQDKLDSMERKLQDARRYDRRKDVGRSPHMRAMKPNFRSDNQINPLYTGRARILHGY